MGGCVKSLLLIFSAAVFLGACTSSPSPVLPPLMLAPLQPEIQVNSEWRRKIGTGVSDGYLHLPPAYSAATAYALDAQGNLEAIHLDSGNIAWRKAYTVPFSSAPVISKDTLYVGTLQGELLAINIRQGAIIWRQQLSSEVLAPVATNGDMVVVRSVDGTVAALRAADGKQLWTHSDSVPALTLRGQSAPVIADDILVYATDEGKLFALTLRNGTELWSRAIAIPQGGTELARMIDVDASPVIYDNTIYVAAYQGRLSAVNLHSGRIVWVREISTHTGLAVDAYRLYLSDSEGQVWALDRVNGATLWKQDKLLRRGVTAPSLQNGYLAVADFNGFVHWLAREDGRLVARTRLSRHDGLDEGEDFEHLKFAKWNNILAKPRSLDPTRILVIDRTGWLEAFKLRLSE
ncbi:MAG: outer membrane protein assembly factor BamB [Gammaproteobacteria bacterium]